MRGEAVDRDVVRAFWDKKSLDERTRWTSHELLSFELDYLRELVPRPRSVLDLGSGHGELSRPLSGPDARLLAVDFAPAYGRSFSSPRHEFVASNLADFETSARFELILLFGVVTSIDEQDELPLYRRIAEWLSDDGLAVVKNQCAVGEQFVVSGYSEDLGTEYSGRYPRAADQAARLREVFVSVDERPYPAVFNRWATSAHVAFVCRKRPG